MTQELTTFADLALSDHLLKALDQLNFKVPSPIQAQTIPWLLQGRDLIGQAQTGTGKTAAFGLPILQRLQAKQSSPQALVLAPTRELAIQVAEHLEQLGAHQPNTHVVVLCGGQDYRPQLKKLRDGAAIVVGTPGRILDHIERGTLDLSRLTTLVLDEADEMLRMGFIEDVETILSKLPCNQTNRFVLSNHAASNQANCAALFNRPCVHRNSYGNCHGKKHRTTVSFCNARGKTQCFIAYFSLRRLSGCDCIRSYQKQYRRSC